MNRGTLGMFDDLIAYKNIPIDKCFENPGTLYYLKIRRYILIIFKKVYGK